MEPYSLRRAAFVLAAIFGFGLVVTSQALAISGTEWFWTTENDQNPVTFDQCLERAPGALATTGVASVRDRGWFYADSSDFHVVLLCINRSHGMNMVLEVAVAGGSRSSTDIGNAINSKFWATGSLPRPSVSNMTIHMDFPGNGWSGDWTQRQGDPTAWDFNFSATGKTVTGTGSGAFNGAAGSFRRVTSSDGYLCTYTLRLAGDGRTFAGTQSCPGFGDWPVTGTITYSQT